MTTEQKAKRIKSKGNLVKALCDHLENRPENCTRKYVAELAIKHNVHLKTMQRAIHMLAQTEGI